MQKQSFFFSWDSKWPPCDKGLFTSKQPKKNKTAFVGILSQMKLLFGPLVIHLVWYILKQLFTSASMRNERFGLTLPSRLGKYPPLLKTGSLDNAIREFSLA